MKLLHALLISIAIGITSVSGQTLTAIPSLTTIPALATGDLLPIHDVSSTATNVRKVALSALRTYMWTDGVMVNSFQIPNAAAPTVDAFAEIAGDNNLWAASRGTMLFYDGTAPVAMVATLVSDVPTNGQVPTWNTGGTITWETPASGGSGDVSTDTIWDAAGDLAVGSGANTAARLAKGTAGQVLKVNSGATGLEWGTDLNTGGGGGGLTYASLASVTSGATSTLVAQYSYGGVIASQATYSIVIPTGTDGENIDLEFQVTGVDSVVTFSGGAVYRVNQTISLGSTPLTFSIGYNMLSLKKRDGKWWMIDSSDPSPETFSFAISDESTDIAAATNLIRWRAPYAMKIVAVYAELNVASSSGTPTFDVKVNGSTILSTKVTIDATETDSATAAAAAVISSPTIAARDQFAFNIDVAGTGAKGAKITILYKR